MNVTKAKESNLVKMSTENAAANLFTNSLDLEAP